MRPGTGQPGQRVKVVQFAGQSTGRLIGKMGYIRRPCHRGVIVQLDDYADPIRLNWDEVEPVETTTAAGAGNTSGGR